MAGQQGVHVRGDIVGKKKGTEAGRGEKYFLVGANELVVDAHGTPKCPPALAVDSTNNADSVFLEE